MKKTVKVEWCENFIRALFKKRIPEGYGIYDGLFWAEAEKSGLWERGTYGTPMSKALERLTVFKDSCNEDGSFVCRAIYLKEGRKNDGKGEH